MAVVRELCFVDSGVDISVRMVETGYVSIAVGVSLLRLQNRVLELLPHLVDIPQSNFRLEVFEFLEK